MSATVAALIELTDRLSLEPPDPDLLVIAGSLLLQKGRLEASDADDKALLIAVDQAGLAYIDVALPFLTPGRLPGPGEDGGLYGMRGRMQAELAELLRTPRSRH